MQVASTGHSGTAWLVAALSRCGVPATHEVRFRHDRDPLGRSLAVDVSWAATPFLADLSEPCVFLARDPIEIVRSLVSAQRTFLTTDTPAARFVAIHHPEILDEPAELLGRAVMFAASWLPAVDVPVVRVEDGAHTVRQVAAYAGHDIDATFAVDVCDELGTCVNSHRSAPVDVEWADVFATRHGDRLAAVAVAHGYAS